MTDRLGYVEPRHSYQPWSLAWFCDGDEGGHIGECYDPEQKEPNRETSPDDWENWAVTNAALPFAENPKPGRPFEFEDKAKAQAAMAACKAALKAKRPLFDWEQKAVAAGWKPPKSWNGAT